MLRRLARVFALLAMSVPAAFAASLVSINVGGLQRTYLIYGQLAGAPKPVIIVLHGLGGDGASMAVAAHLGDLAIQDGFIAVFPDGLAKLWNHYPAGGTVPQDVAQEYQKVGIPSVPDDAAFIHAILAGLMANGQADTKRVYLVGYSAGGFMSLKLMCEDANSFAAVALISSGMPSDNGNTCHPTHPIPALIEHGTADDHVPYNGGSVMGRPYTVWSVEDLNKWFVTLDGCGGAPATSTVKPARLPTTLSTWTCTNGPLDFYKVTGGPHIVYQFPPPASTIWDFLKSHSL